MKAVLLLKNLAMFPSFPIFCRLAKTMSISSRVSNIESDDSQNVGLEDYNNIFDRIFPNFTTPSIKITLG